MKYPPAPLTPFLASPPRIRRRTHIPNEQRELKDHQPTLSASIACRLLKSLASLFAPRILCFQRLAASFAKIPGGGVPPRLSLVVYPERRSRGELNFCPLLFSRTYKSLLTPHRSACPAFSSTYKPLFSQPLSFHIYTKPPGVTHPIPAVVSRAIVSLLT